MSNSATPWTVAHQAPLSMGFSSQACCSGLPCPSPGDLPEPGIKPMSFMSPALAGRFFTTSATWEALLMCRGLLKIETPLTKFQLFLEGEHARRLKSQKANLVMMCGLAQVNPSFLVCTMEVIIHHHGWNGYLTCLSWMV